MSSSGTGIVCDEIFFRHNLAGHPENKKRLQAIIKELERSQLLEKVVLLNSRIANTDEISLCHSEEYITSVKEFCSKGGGYLDPDTYANQYSFTAATTAVGSSIDLTKDVIKGELKNGFALLRPPGHHALSNRAMGFCLFGNIAIAAKFALSQTQIKKVVIVDFDVHHGNGTQALVGDDPNVLFISTHQYPFYPGTGSIREIGSGDAEGTIVNIPLQTGVGDDDFKIVFEEVIIPALHNFRPDLILVSAGYDAHWKDPLANLNLSLNGFDWISKQLINCAANICNGKIVFFLEGGYDLEELSYGVTNTIRSLLGINGFEDPIGKSNHNEPDIKKLITELRKIHNL